MSIFNNIECLQEKSLKLTIYHFKNWLFNDRLFFDDYYQCDHIWKETEQQNFLNNIFSGSNVGYFLFSEIPYYFDQNYTYEVIDGKQRLITIKMFLNNEIPLITEGKKVFYSNLTSFDQLKFKNFTIPTIILDYSEDKEENIQLKNKIQRITNKK